MPKENQRSVSDWATKTFGNPTPEVAVRRLLKEAYELEKKIEEGCSHEEIADEVADIFITGYKVFDVIGYQATACVDHKMEINRARKWKLHGDGTGQHIED